MPASRPFAQLMAAAALVLMCFFSAMALWSAVASSSETIIYKNSAEPRLVGSPHVSRVNAIGCQVSREQFQQSVSTVAVSWKYLEGEEAAKFLKVYNSWDKPTEYEADVIGFGFNSAGSVIGVALFHNGCTVSATALSPGQYRALMEKALGRVVGSLFGVRLSGVETGV